jgi:gluconolactonase
MRISLGAQHEHLWSTDMDGRYLFAFTSLLVSQGADPLPPEGTITPVKVADFPAYSEGVVIDQRGAVFVSIRNPHSVLRLGPDSAPAPWLQLHIPNGHKILPDGTHWVAGDGTLVHVAPDGRVLDSITSDGVGRPLRRPNDLALDGDGGFYFSDPGPGIDRKSQSGRVFYMNRQQRIHQVADSLCYPNGLVVRADGKVLFLSDSCDNRVYRYQITAPGALGARQVFAILPDSSKCDLDGMTLDAAGRLFIAHNGCGRIEVLSAEGRLLRRYAAGNRLASNVAFGGPELGHLYVTGSPVEKSGAGALFRLELGILGRSSRALPKRRR